MDDSREAGSTTSNARLIGLILGPLLAGLTLLLGPPPGFSEPAWLTAALTVLMAVWWMTEALPLPVTALLPIALLPVLGVADLGTVAAPYASPVVFLFLGGFIIAAAVTRWSLHRRIALTIMGTVGARPDRLVGGVMLASALLSMWISNTATAAMMLPIALSIITFAETQVAERDPAWARSFTVAILLAIAFGANIGGIGTLIGTPPNAVMAGFLADSQGIQIGFVDWMAVGVPVAGVLLVVAWWALVRLVFAVGREPLPGVATFVDRERGNLGALSVAERRLLVVAGLTIAAWLLRPLLENLLPGLSLSDAGIAITAAIALFVVPAGGWRARPLLVWRDTRGIAWGVLILVGGGLSLGTAIENSGLATAIANLLAGMGGLPLWAMLLVLAGLTMGLSHVTSNTGTAATLMPVVVGLALSIGQSPLVLAATVALAASCAFMLPVATPPNAVVFASERLRVVDMIRGGGVINAIAVVVVVLAAWLLVPLVLGSP